MENDHQLRILYLYQILLCYSDADHPLSTQELMNLMESQHHISVHRTTISKYIEQLNTSGFEVMEIRSREKKYYLDDRLFELPEIKLLIDAVQASKLITPHKSRQLISKLMQLTSKPNAEKLKRNLYVTGRVKSDNEKSYYIVEAINDAINMGRRISFYYTDYNARKERVLKNDGKPYILSPYALIWDGDFYYVLGLNHARNQLNTFRVDRISRQPEILAEQAAPAPDNLNLADYSREVFRMYATEDPVEVSLLCDNSLMKHIIDQFGMDVETEVVDANHFRAKVKVCASPTFYRWVFGWCGQMKIESPAAVREEYHCLVKAALKE